MLSACLLLSSALLLPQDAAATDTSATVREFLEDVAATLYDPVDAGLESLAFDLDVALPLGPGGVAHLGAVHVTWDAETNEPNFDVTPADEVPPMLTQMVQAQGGGDVGAVIEGMCVSMAQQPLLQALNRGFDVDGMLANNTASLGISDGQASVTFQPNAAMAAQVPIKQFIWYFDDDLRPMRKVATMEQQGPMGAMTITITEDHSWQDTDGGLVLESIATTQDFGMMSMSTSRTIHYTDVGPVRMVSRFVDVTEAMPMAGVPASSTETTLDNLMVNGRSADEPAADAPAADAPADEG